MFPVKPIFCLVNDFIMRVWITVWYTRWRFSVFLHDFIENRVNPSDGDCMLRFKGFRAVLKRHRINLKPQRAFHPTKHDLFTWGMLFFLLELQLLQTSLMELIKNANVERKTQWKRNFYCFNHFFHWFNERKQTNCIIYLFIPVIIYLKLLYHN